MQEKPLIAYFCAEFALDEQLPIYSGGLGILAGDVMREAEQNSLNFVGVGLLYKEGYFKQVLSENGEQSEIPAFLNLDTAPISKIKDETGTPLQLKLYIEDRVILVEIWKYEQGSIPVYLLDTDVEGNSPLDKRLTLSLYPGENEWRIQQEIVLGVGGARALSHLGYEPNIYHLNEGHSAFALLEVAHQQMKHKGWNFPEAFTFAKERTVFTNHTLIPSGNDVFETELVSRLLEGYAKHLGLEITEVLAMGSIPGDPKHFSMTHLALKESAVSSAVSKSHAQFAKVTWPDSKLAPITNGVCRTFWQTQDFKNVFEQLSNGLEVSDEEIWEFHLANKKTLINFLKTHHDLEFKTQKLTLSWARRVTGYKQPLLLFSDVAKLKSILEKSNFEVQILLSGKAHPNDTAAKTMISSLAELIRKHNLENHIAFLPNYSITQAKLLVAGADVWVNTPIKGQEACGTSGMKSGMNGGLQFAISDGWTDEIDLHELGFAINPVDSANSLYSLLEEVVVPLYYNRDEDGLPSGWITKMRQTIMHTSQDFSTSRMIHEYQDKLYSPLLSKQH